MIPLAILKPECSPVSWVVGPIVSYDNFTPALKWFLYVEKCLKIFAMIWIISKETWIEKERAKNIRDSKMFWYSILRACAMFASCYIHILRNSWCKLSDISILITLLRGHPLIAAAWGIPNTYGTINFTILTDGLQSLERRLLYFFWSLSEVGYYHGNLYLVDCKRGTALVPATYVPKHVWCLPLPRILSIFPWNKRQMVMLCLFYRYFNSSGRLS